MLFGRKHKSNNIYEELLTTKIHNMITEKQYAPNIFQHCSTISKGPPGAGTFLAYYTGDTEMHQTQHVRIHWWSDNGFEADPVDLEDYTGNPVILETFDGPRIIYSKFETLVSNRIEWWQYCSLWSRALNIVWEHGKPKISAGIPHQIIFEEPGDNKPPTGLGYLPRCKPIWIKDEYLLPLYREHHPHFHGVIVCSKDGIDWKFRGKIGEGISCIQPTIWENGGKLCSLSRKFSRGSKPYAYYSESLDVGMTWSDPKYSPYYNANNSVFVVTARGFPLVIWNDDHIGRNNICLGTFNMNKPMKIAQMDSYGSYPSACVDKNFLYVTYTAKPNPLKTPNVKTIIKLKTYNLEAVLNNTKYTICPRALNY